MESNSISAGAVDDARAALHQLDLDGAALADRLVTPWWYHPILGANAALLVVAALMPHMWLVAIILVVVNAANLMLMLVYRRRYGVWVTGSGGRAGTATIAALVALIVVGVAATLAIRFSTVSSWWAVLPILAVFMGVWILGRVFDRRLREHLRSRDAGIRS